MKIHWLPGFLLLHLANSQLQCCLTSLSRSCLTCPNNTHLFRGNCLINVDNCESYSDGFECSKCLAGFALDANLECKAEVKKDSEVLLNIDAIPTEYADAYMLSVDYFKSFKTQVRNATVVGAKIKNYPNGTMEVTLEFQADTKYFRGVLQPNLSSFIFQEISFVGITTPTLGKPVVTPKEPITSSLNTSNQTHSQKVSQLLAEAKLKESKISIFISGTITQYENGTSLISGIFQGQDKADVFSITGSIDSAGKVEIKELKQTGFAPIPTNAFNYTNISDNSASENFLLALDFVSSLLPNFPSKPTQAQQANSITTDNTIIFKLIYTFPNTSTTELNVSLNTATFTLTLLTQKQLTVGTNSSSAQWVSVDVSKAYQDVLFIVVKEYVNKQSSGKFNNSVLVGLSKMSTALANYKMQFEESGYLWEVLANVNSTSLAVSGYSETRKEALKANTTNTTTPNTTTPNKTTPNTTTPNTTTPNTTTPNTTTPNTTTPNTTTPNTTTPNTSAPRQLPQSVLNAASGMIQSTESELLSDELKSIDSLVREVNPSELSGSNLIGAFYTSSSFTKNYQIYYQKTGQLQIYEARVSRDNLRNRTYILSFTKM